MSDADVFAPRRALRRTPPAGSKVISRGPTPARSSPKPVTPKDVSPVSRFSSQEPVQRSMTSPIRDSNDSYVQVPASSNSLAVASLTPRASTVEPVTPSYVRPSSSVGGTSLRRKALTPHAIRGYSNRPTPHKNQGKRRNSRFAGEDDDIFQTLKQFSRLTAPTTKPFIPTPKAITPKAASTRRKTLDGIRLNRDLNIVSSDEESEVIRPPRLSNVSLKLIGKNINVLGNEEYDDGDDDISPPPQFTSPLMKDEDDEATGTVNGGTPRFEVARRAVADNDRRMSFVPNPFDRFRDFEDVVMDESIIGDGIPQEVGGFDDQPSFELDQEEGMEGLSFADRTADLHGDVSNFFDPQAIGIPDDDTDFRLEQVEIPEPGAEGELPGLVNDDSSPPPLSGDFPAPAGFIDSDVDDNDGIPFDYNDPIPFESGLRSAHDKKSRPINLSGEEEEGNSRPAKKPRTKKELPLSAHGIPYPSLPPRVIKSIIARTSKQKLSKEALALIVQASEQYFENLGEDLGSFARHAKRKTVEEGDVLQVLRRHRLLNDKTTVFSLANQYLPRELLQDIKIQVPKKNLPKQRRRRVRDEEGDETVEVEEE
ncbi:hypothetical protein ABW20_dc0103526 [Dactylellina cionopaga]|nr:hypothetical protein ABW20_dc0103526 [Dactylellina cionopaga]